MQIDVVFDTVCPWCYVGKRRFERALKMRPNMKPTLRYRSFLLNPDLPPQGVDRREYLERKFGGSAQYERIVEALVFTGKGEGINFALDKIKRTPNSANSHRLIRLARTMNCQTEAVNVLFSAYFERGLDIGNVEVLVKLAEEIGLERGMAYAHLSTETDLNAVYTENARMHRLGITGVPCYIFNEGRAIAGAQEPEILVRMFDMALAESAGRTDMQSTG
ncbi:MAG: DsbA family oxidoreductase [Alphaproteobacteria bacterium]|nr:DsbA family oxidoreductase [Alphaproteobacteria bacterium]PHX98501.1 MAG: disulfide bond formation protein DsbA [Rhodospirillaceae bacterium]